MPVSWSPTCSPAGSVPGCGTAGPWRGGRAHAPRWSAPGAGQAPDVHEPVGGRSPRSPVLQGAHQSTPSRRRVGHPFGQLRLKVGGGRPQQAAVDLIPWAREYPRCGSSVAHPDGRTRSTSRSPVSPPPSAGPGLWWTGPPTEAVIDHGLGELRTPTTPPASPQTVATGAGRRVCPGSARRPATVAAKAASAPGRRRRGRRCW